MPDLDKQRAIISETDRQIAKLFEKRMRAAGEIAQYKKERGLLIEDKARERLLLEKEIGYIEQAELRTYYINLLQSMMEISKRYQHSLIDGMRVSYSGVPGAFAHITAKKIFEQAETVAYPDFKSAYDAVCEGECDVAVLPIENSIGGDVGQVMDLAFFGPLRINGVYEADIVQNLLAVKGADIANIKRVISHPQALSQCADYIKAHGFETINAENTALAAKKVARDGDVTVAAIGSDDAAERYGLCRIESHINGNSTNTTRFAVFSRMAAAENPRDGRFIIMFTVKNEPGSLGKAINAIGKNGFNLLALKSRPTKALMWNYYFFAEGEGCISSESGKRMFSQLSENCADLKVIGSFEKEITL